MYQKQAQTVRRVAEAIVRTVRGREEGALIEETLWPAVESCGVERCDFYDAIDLLLMRQVAFQSYDRLYVEVGS